MKASDICVGDWVYNKHHEENIQIKPYDFFVHGHDNNGAFVVSSTIVSGRDFEPIPLTEEILVKNGFEKGRDEDVTTFKYGNLFLFYYPDGTGLYSYNTQIIIHYVHTLQHLLRLIGIKKEIEL